MRQAILKINSQKIEVRQGQYVDFCTERSLKRRKGAVLQFLWPLDSHDGRWVYRPSLEVPEFKRVTRAQVNAIVEALGEKFIVKVKDLS